MSFEQDLVDFRAAHPDVASAEIFMVDLNARIRGKIVPIDALDKLAAGAMKLPSSTPALDFFSEDVVGGGLAIETGDPDGVVDPVPGSLSLMPWADKPTAQVQVTIRMPDGSPADVDPRTILATVVDRARSMGLTPDGALEQEFFLIDAQAIAPPVDPQTGARLSGGQVYDLDIARAFQPVLDGIIDSVTAFGGLAETIVPEFATGQFEVNLTHQPDLLRAADEAMWLRRAIRGTARAHGYDASFMAKPWAFTIASGLHLHLSLLDADGANIFAGDGPAASIYPGEGPGLSPALHHAVAGMVSHMADAMLIFAPHLNAYRRLVPGALAPVEASWAIDNRGAAIRVPETHGPGARIEHRVAAADANPYLVSAAILSAILDGIETEAPPPPALTGEIRPGMADPLPVEWLAATERFETSEFIARALGSRFRHVFATMKRQEHATLQTRVTDVEHDVYLRKS